MFYKVYNARSGYIFGTYEADTPQDAILALARNAGYASIAEMDETTGGNSAHLVAEEIA